MRSFYILNARVSSPSEPVDTAQTRSLGRERLRFRDIVWAYHSESEEILLSASTAACGGKMRWADAKALGVFLWLNSVDKMVGLSCNAPLHIVFICLDVLQKAQMEMIARNQYMAGDDRDPTACSLFYFALRKTKLVHGLWKQAAWHKEQQMMLKFLSNDFDEPRWRTSALKNAYALLGKQRFGELSSLTSRGTGRFNIKIRVCGGLFPPWW